MPPDGSGVFFTIVIFAIVCWLVGNSLDSTPVQTEQERLDREAKYHQRINDASKIIRAQGYPKPKFPTITRELMEPYTPVRPKLDEADDAFAHKGEK